MRFPGWSAEEKRCVACGNVEQKQCVIKKKKKKNQLTGMKKRLIKLEDINSIVGLYSSQMERGRISTGW